MKKKKITLWTIGHSTKTLSDFVAILKSHNIQLLVDIRKVPHSRRNPQFDKETLPKELAEFCLEYFHMAGLGGLRRPSKGSQENLGWRNASFRGFADYMQSQEFERNIEELISFGRRRRTAIMCAESVPWRCHRTLVADALTVRGLRVEHILGKKTAREHKLTPFAHLEGGGPGGRTTTILTYPAGTRQQETNAGIKRRKKRRKSSVEHDG